jgi:hypothetical protein
MSRTDETEESYRSRTANIIEQASEACGRELALPIDAPMIAEFAVQQKPNLRPSTWRQYRAALKFTFEKHQCFEIEFALQKLAAADVLAPGCRNRSEPRTSAQKLRRLDLGDLGVLKSHAEREGARRCPDGTERTGVFTIRWLLLGSILGLRPCEWCWAELRGDKGQWALVVQNAKSTNARGFAEPRILNLDAFPVGLVSAIGTFIREFQRSVIEKGYKHLHGRCAKWLYRAYRFKFPKRLQHIALYTPRHEAAARWKRFYNHCEVAALLGHAADNSAGRHYQPRRAGSRRQKFDKLLPRPAEHLVSKVRITGKARFADRHMRAQRQSDVGTTTMTYSPDF